MNRLHAVVVAAAAAAVFAVAAAADTIRDEKYGYTMQIPPKWKRIPMPSDEEWIIAKYLSERAFPTKDGWTHTPDIRVVYLPPTRKDKPKADVKKGPDGTTITIGGSKKSYRDFKSYLQDNASDGGWYISKEEETTVNGIKATWMEIKWEKLTTPRHGLAVVFHRETGAEYAVIFEVLEEQWDKVGRELTNCVRTFKFTEAKGDISGGATSGGEESLPGGAAPPEVKVGPDGKPLVIDRNSPEERKKRRDAALKKELEHCRSNLPKGWREVKSKNFFCFTHADEKYTKRALDQAEGMRAWTEKAFGVLGTGEASPLIIRICENSEEERAFHSGSRGTGWGGGNTYTTNKEDLGNSLFALGWMNSWVLQNWVEDRDPEAFQSVPTWLQTGLNGYVSTGVLSKGRFDFRPDQSELVTMRQAAKEGKILSTKDIFAADWEMFTKVEGSWNQCQAFVRFLLEGPGAQDKRLKGKIFEVLKVCGDIRREKDGSPGEEYKEPETEEEEEEQSKKRQERWKTEEKEFLAEVSKRAFKDLTDADWAAIDRTWRSWAAQYQ